MPRFELFEKLPHGPEPSAFHVLQALADAFRCIGTGRNIGLIVLSILNHRVLPLNHRSDHPRLP